MRTLFFLLLIFLAYPIIKLVFNVWLFSRRLKKQAKQQQNVKGERTQNGRIIEDAEFTEIKDDSKG